jgi:hypothetical protein
MTLAPSSLDGWAVDALQGFEQRVYQGLAN